MPQIIFAKILWAKVVNMLTHSAICYAIGNPNGLGYGMIPFIEIRRRDLEIIGIDYSTQQNTNKLWSKRKEKKKSFFWLGYEGRQEWKKYILGCERSHFCLRSIFCCYNCTTLSEVQQYHFVPVTGVLFIIFYWLECYLFLPTQTLSTAKSLQWEKNIYVYAAPGDSPG